MTRALPHGARGRRFTLPFSPAEPGIQTGFLSGSVTINIDVSVLTAHVKEAV